MDPNCIRSPLIFEFLVVSYDLDSNRCQSRWLKNSCGLYLEKYLGIALVTVSREIKLKNKDHFFSFPVLFANILLLVRANP